MTEPGDLGPSWLLWGKADPKVGAKGGHTAAWHPLPCHVLDVMAVAELLITEGLSPGFLPRMAQAMRLPEPHAKAWLCLFVGLHDMGKASPTFQRKWKPCMPVLLKAGFDIDPEVEEAPHGIVTVVEASRLLVERNRVDKDLAWRIARAVGAHHGSFPTDHDADGVRDKPRKLGKNPLWAIAREELFATMERFAGTEGRPLPSPQAADDHAFFVLLAGLTSVADWIGSMADIFQYVPAPRSYKDYAATCRNRAREALTKVGFHHVQSSVKPQFQALFSRTPWPLHVAAEDLADKLHGPSLVLIEAPMGEGKTEAALLLSHALAANAGHGGLFFGLPTQATSNQMLGRVRKFLDNAYPTDRKNLHLCHGSAALSDDYQILQNNAPKTQGVYGQPGPVVGHQGAVVADAWFTQSKRALLSLFAVGTIDQALLGILRVRHAFVRLFGVGGKTVIVDEVHAYDMYTSTLVDRFVEWMGAMGASVVLLSATLPANRRAALMNAFAGRPIDLPEAPYPRVSWVSHQGPEVKADASTVGCRRPPVEVALQMTGPRQANVALALTKALDQGGCAAWICNTVDRAQAAYVALRTLREQGSLPADTDLSLLHARLLFEDRQKREKQAEQRFGPGQKHRPHRAILVGTQVLEQSLDLDFDLMVTDLAPIDLMLQRCGRLHRHPRSRPSGLQQPTLWCIRPDAIDATEGPSFRRIAGIYEQSVMLRTWLALQHRPRWVLPGDMESLIETVYGQQPLQNTHEAIVRRLDDLDQDFARRRVAETSDAKNRAMPTPHHEDDPFTSLRMPFEEDDPDVHKSLQALTRLGEPSIDVVCLWGTDQKPTLDQAGQHPVVLSEKPTRDKARNLLMRSVGLSSKRIFGALHQRPVPSGWADSPFLSRHRFLAFGAGDVQLGNYRIALDDDLGLVIEPLTNKKTP